MKLGTNTNNSGNGGTFTLNANNTASNLNRNITSQVSLLNVWFIF